MAFLQGYLPRFVFFGVTALLSPTIPAADRSLSYQNDIQPIFETKCLACHGCYDAPCQLKLEYSLAMKAAEHSSTNRTHATGSRPILVKISLKYENAT